MEIIGEIIGHVTSTVRKQRGTNDGAQLAFSFSFSPGIAHRHPTSITPA